MSAQVDLGPTSEDWRDEVGNTAAYQNAVKQLTALNKSLNAQAESDRKAHRDEVRSLKAQLHEGLSPELMALRRQLQHWRTRALTAEGRLKEIRKGATGQ